jgi:hypothetical protein
VQHSGQREVWVDGGATKVFGIGILEVGVASGAGADRDVFQLVLVEDVAEGWLQQDGSTGCHLGQNWLEGADCPVRIKFRNDERVGRQAVGTWVVAGDDAGDVGTGDGWKDGVVVVAGNAVGGQASKVGH